MRLATAGRANLPGSTREREMLQSFARMVPELLRHSDRKDVLELLKPELKAAHRPRDVQRDDATAVEDEARLAAAKRRKAPAVGGRARGSATLWETEPAGAGAGAGSSALAPELLLVGLDTDEAADEALVDFAGV